MKVSIIPANELSFLTVGVIDRNVKGGDGMEQLNLLLVQRFTFKAVYNQGDSLPFCNCFECQLPHTLAQA